MPGASSLVSHRDPSKAESDLKKHGGRFAEAMAVFRDAPASTLFDDEGSSQPVPCCD